MKITSDPLSFLRRFFPNLEPISSANLLKKEKPARAKTRAFCSFLFLAALPSLHANIPGGGDVGANVTLTDNGSSVTLANGVISAVIDKSGAQVTSLKYNGFETVGQSGAPHTKIYFSMDGGTSYSNPSNCIYSIKANTSSLVDISCKHVFTSGDTHAVDIDTHFVLRLGNSGLYVYSVLTHPASYPAFTVGEFRMVWSSALDPKNSGDFLLENIYIDSLRHWQAPSAFDLAHSSPTEIGEISLQTTGVRAGQFDCKYEYAAEYYKVGTYGFASNVNKIGAWVVLGNYEYFNDGPPKNDLAAAEGTTLLHFGRNHFNGSSTSIGAGQNWSKIFGPYLLYLNSSPSGADACWADAQNQVVAEHSAWPYSWLTGNSDYPLANARGAVAGKFTVSDSLRLSQTGGGAWVGVTNAPSGTNWQFWSEGYEYWVQAAADGSFTIPDVRPGSYTFSAFVSGEVGEYTKTNVTVTAGGTTSLGEVRWNVVHPGLSIAWEIGVPDRTAAEFAGGSTNYYVPYEYKELHNQYPNPVDFTVGSSNPATVFPYVQSALWQPDGSTVRWPWHIRFNLSNVPSTGNATLTIAFASVNSATLQLYVNDDSTVFTTVHPAVTGGNGLLREVVHGKYDLEFITIPVSRLRNGANTITLVQSSLGSGNHLMYDYLNLEMPNGAPRQAVYQAEDGLFSAGGVIETTNPGWTGTGYVNSSNLTGSWVQWTVNVPTAGNYRLDFRFANGTTADRPASLSVNGVVEQSAAPFTGTGTWTSWSDAVITAALNAGPNTIRLTATTANGCANLDKLTVGP